MPKVTADELMKLYRSDRLVAHTVPPALIDKRPDHMQDQHSIMCGSILFNEGYHHKPDNNWVHNAVARFGDDSKQTVFATLHDLHKIFDHHEELEKQVLSRLARDAPSSSFMEMYNPQLSMPGFNSNLSEASWAAGQPQMELHVLTKSHRCPCRNHKIREARVLSTSPTLTYRELLPFAPEVQIYTTRMCLLKLTGQGLQTRLLYCMLVSYHATDDTYECHLRPKSKAQSY